MVIFTLTLFSHFFNNWPSEVSSNLCTVFFLFFFFLVCLFYFTIHLLIINRWLTVSTSKYKRSRSVMPGFHVIATIATIAEKQLKTCSAIAAIVAIMETSWSATVAIVATAIAAIAEIEKFLSRASQRSKFPKWPLFQRTCKLCRSLNFGFLQPAIVRLEIVAIIWKPGIRRHMTHWSLLLIRYGQNTNRNKWIMATNLGIISQIIDLRY